MKGWKRVAIFMLLKHFSWGYGRYNASPGCLPLSFMRLCFSTYSDIFIWRFFVDFKVSCQYVQTCIIYSWNNAIAWTLNVFRKASHSVSGKGTSSHSHFQHHTKSQVLYKRKQTDVVHKNCISNRSPLFLLHLQVPKDTGKASLAGGRDIFYKRG